MQLDGNDEGVGVQSGGCVGSRAQWKPSRPALGLSLEGGGGGGGGGRLGLAIGLARAGWHLPG